MKIAIFWGVVVLGSPLLAACQEARQSAPLPAGPAVVEVRMGEYRFEYDEAIGNGRVLFRVANIGRVRHEMRLFPLTDDIPPIEEQLRSSNRRSIPPFAGISVLEPGAKTTFAADLAPGTRYALLCFVLDTKDTPHALLGMNSEFRAMARSPVSRGNVKT